MKKFEKKSPQEKLFKTDDLISLRDSLTPQDSISLNGFIDTHIHTFPDIRPRILNDIEASSQAQQEGMKAIVIKGHVEPTSGRALMAKSLSDIDVFGGVCLNYGVGGFNPNAVEISAQMGGKFVWFPTISLPEMRKIFSKNYSLHSSLHSGSEFLNSKFEELESILNIIAQNDMVLATGHLRPAEIFYLIDEARSSGVKRIVINHPLTAVVGANLEEQKEMAQYAFLEHCFVACMPLHDNLDSKIITEAIKYVGSKKSIMATDFGQIHNPSPVVGFKMFIKSMKDWGISKKDIDIMCSSNPRKLIY